MMNKVIPVNLKKDGEIAYKVSSRVVLGSEVCRMMEIEERITKLRDLYAGERNEKGRGVITTQALFLKDNLQRLKNKFYTDLERWAELSLTTEQMINRWYNHNAVGLKNNCYKSIELNTGETYYVQFGSGN